MIESNHAQGSAMWRFIAGGMRDAERRVRRMTSPDGVLERPVVNVIEQSAVYRATHAAINRLTAVAGGSALLRHATSAWRSWRQLPLAARRARRGAMLLVATAVHIGLTLMQGPQPGWLWLLVPAIAAAAGAVQIAAGARAAQDGCSLARE